jgi:Uma2 family endonuclease
MVAEIQRVTADEFEKLATLPANADRRLELVGGEIVEVVSNTYASYLATRLSYYINAYLSTHDIGYTTGTDGGYPSEMTGSF